MSSILMYWLDISEQADFVNYMSRFVRHSWRIKMVSDHNGIEKRLWDANQFGANLKNYERII